MMKVHSILWNHRFPLKSLHSMVFSHVRVFAIVHNDTKRTSIFICMIFDDLSKRIFVFNFEVCMIYINAFL